MQNLVQARSRNAALGEAIYLPIKGLAELDVHIRRGQVTMVAAAPGIGKSALVQAVLHHGGGARGPKNTVLYFSADSGPEVMYERAGALSTRMNMDTIRQLVDAGNTEQVDAAILARQEHMYYDFTGHISREHIVQTLEGYLELNGHFPEVVVVDNLKNAADETDPDEFRQLGDTVEFLVELARDTGAAIIALHHVGGNHEDGETPVPLGGLRGKVSKAPALILTLHKPGDGQMNVSIVKNRSGKSDPSGRLYVRLETDLSRMAFNG